MKLNRMLATVLAAGATLALGATLFTATSASAVGFNGTSGDFTFTDNGVAATITGYTGSSREIAIPDTVIGSTGVIPVTAVGPDAFREKFLTGLIIPSSVITLGEFAFAYNSITSVTIPDGVTTIGAYAFYQNLLTTVTIPNSVTTIGQIAFRNNKLSSLKIGSGVTTIPYSAFTSNLLTSVIIPDNVTTIRSYAFYDNTLTSVTIGSGVISIEDQAFDINPGLETALFLGDAPTVTSDGDLRSLDSSNSAFAVTFTYGNTTFGDGPTWQGYPLTQPSQPPVTSLSDVTAGVSAGVRSATLDPAVFGLAPFSHNEQSIETIAGISVDDLTDAGLGWNVTIASSALTWAAANGGPTTGTSIPASAVAVTTVGRVTTVAGENWNGETALGSLDSPVTVLSTHGGNGYYTAPLTLTVTVPGQASVGTYAGTLTTTISAAP